MNALDKGLEMALTYYQFPQTLWRKIYTNNLAERLNREIKRRTGATGSFTDSCSALMMVCARLRRINRQWEEEDEPYMEGVDFLEG